MSVPKQRGAGQRGGDGHRSNKGAFRASGGSVKPPKKGCPLALLVGMAYVLTPATAFVALLTQGL
jgi:hypothetical protein